MNQMLMLETAQRLVSLRTEILESYPFFGRLLMRLPFGFAECETAYTDMKRIVFDPEFAKSLDDKQLCFVMLHELMHCVLKHCTRMSGRIRYLYNIACDIVVNSIILEAMNLKDMEIAGSKVIHLSPDGYEGRNFNAEELYDQILKKADEKIIEEYGISIFDNHSVWEEIMNDPLLEQLWDSNIRKAVNSSAGNSGIPASVERYVVKVSRLPKISWKQVLHDYIQNDQCDYVYTKPDNRFSGDFVMPSFQENVNGSKIEKVFFYVDTSGSVKSEAIAEAYEEIKDAIEQIGKMSGILFFFDSQVSDPSPFESVSDIEKINPIGGGGTSFKIIFDSLSKYDDADLPGIIIIITDGYAEFPEESASMDIPVIWLVIDSDVDSPWGECIHVYTDENIKKNEGVQNK